MATNHTVALSVPKAKKVRGCAIERLPLGGYLRAIRALQDFPDDLVAACFPGQDLGGILAQFRELDKDKLLSMIGNALLAAPKHFIHFAAELTGIDEEMLLNDPEIGLDGLLEILVAWAEVNKLGDFLPAVRKLTGKIRMATGSSRKPNTGSNA